MESETEVTAAEASPHPTTTTLRLPEVWAAVKWTVRAD
jgi:hypothetical protein